MNPTKKQPLFMVTGASGVGKSTVCANISQIGMPIVLCGCTTPEQNEFHEERKLFEKFG